MNIITSSMSVDKEVKNTSLSSLDHQEPQRTNNVPVRNALSSVKRPKENLRLFKANLKARRLRDLTQEMLEAQNEPLRKVDEAEIDENTDSEKNEGNDLEVQKSENEVDHFPDKAVESFITEDRKSDCKHDSKDTDLGVAWLETPVKTDVYKKYNASEAVPSKISSKLSVTPIELDNGKEFVTPKCAAKRNDKSVGKSKIQCSIDAKLLHRTPNNYNVTNRETGCHSLTKLTTPQTQFKNGESVMNARMNINRLAGDSAKSSMKSSNMNLQQRNKENIVKKSKPKVQFSLPIKETDHSFKRIAIKNVTYVILNQLGIGGSSVVYHCYDPHTKIERAIKKVDLSSDVNAIGYINEVKVLHKLQKCTRIIKMFDYEIIDSEKALLVVLEKGGSDLAKILKDLSTTNEHLPMYMLIFYWMEMLYAVKQIHENGIIHSDLKPGNFIRVEDGLKLIDFGIASCLQNDMTSVVRNIPVGSFNYISPEALINQPTNNCNSPNFGKQKFKISYKSDVWSLGCMLYQFVYRKTPFQHIGHMWAKLTAIMDPSHKIDYPDVNWVPPKIVNTVKKCLQYDMKARPSIDDLIQEYENIWCGAEEFV